METVDGSMLEGGGQILRMTMALSCLMKKPVRIVNIRAGRASPGLKAQHLAGLTLTSRLCQGQLTGAEMGSQEVTFRPGRLTSGSFTVETGTAGSVALLLQVALPCVMFAAAPVELVLRGGTNAAFAPQMDYTEHVFRPLLRRFGADFQCHLSRRGCFPRGGGEVRVSVEPLASALQAVKMLDAGRVSSVNGVAFTGGRTPFQVAQKMALEASKRLRVVFPDAPVHVEPSHDAKCPGSGSGLVLWAHTSTGCVLGGSALGSKKVSDGEVVDLAVQELIDSTEAAVCVDKYCQDQGIIFMALAAGDSSVRAPPPTLHTRTAVHVAETLTQSRFSIEECDQHSCIIHCTGIGYTKSL